MKYNQDIQHRMENTVLGMVIENNKLFYEHHQKLHKDLFAPGLQQAIFNAFEKSREDGTDADVLSLAEAMPGAFDTNFDHVNSIIANISYDIPFIKALGYLLASYKMERYKEVLSSSMNDVHAGSDLEKSMEQLEKAIVELRSELESKINHVSKSIDGVFQNIIDLQNNKGTVGVDTGFYKLNEHTGGWQKSDLIIIAGNTSQGKTSFVLNSMLNSALNSKSNWVFYSLEMSAIQLTTRLLSIHSGIHNKPIQFGKLNNDDITRLERSGELIKKTGIFTDDCESSSFSEIVNSIRSMAIQRKAEVVVVDYLQLVTMRNNQSRENEVGAVARGFKNLAKELNIPIICLSQLKRRKETSVEPRMSDLRDSGQIEEAADVVAFIHRPEYYGIKEYDNGESTEGRADIIFAKGRNIGLDKINLGFKAQCTKFYESDPDNDGPF